LDFRDIADSFEIERNDSVRIIALARRLLAFELAPRDLYGDKIALLLFDK
jgi:hypothetical protein